jgi:hypothetical protein
MYEKARTDPILTPTGGTAKAVDPLGSAATYD